MLYFGVKPPFSFERLLGMCEGVISREDIDIVKASARLDGACGGPKAGSKWRDFDTTLRNELVKIRASRKKTDPGKYIRGEAYPDPFISHIAIHAQRNPSILEAEKALDKERWRFLEELGTQNIFCLESLIVYANKLLILERWERINAMDKSQALEKALARERAV